MTHKASLYGNRDFAHRLVDAAPSGSVMTINAPRRERFKECVHCGKRFEKDARNTWAYWERAKYCSRSCVGLAHTIHANANRQPIEKVFSKWFDKGDGCWEWKGAIDRDGYGAFSYAGKMYKAHRMSLEIDGRPVPKGMFACHRCDNPKCVRPDHLYAGTHEQNVSDMVSRMRHKYGSRHYAAKITEADVIAIRKDPRKTAEIAKDYGINSSNITMIKNRRTWRHIP